MVVVRPAGRGAGAPRGEARPGFTPGYDLATGIGTPKMAALITARR
jgi:hypothetical protein